MGVPAEKCVFLQKNALFCRKMRFSGGTAQETARAFQGSRIKSFHKTIPRETNVTPMNANRAVRNAPQWKQGLWGQISVVLGEIYARQRTLAIRIAAITFARDFSPCAPAEARRWFFFDFGEGHFVGNLTGILWDFFWSHQNKGSKISGKISEHCSWGIFTARKNAFGGKLHSADVPP